MDLTPLKSALATVSRELSQIHRQPLTPAELDALTDARMASLVLSAFLARLTLREMPQRDVQAASAAMLALVGNPAH